MSVPSSPPCQGGTVSLGSVSGAGTLLAVGVLCAHLLLFQMNWRECSLVWLLSHKPGCLLGSALSGKAVSWGSRLSCHGLSQPLPEKPRGEIVACFSVALESTQTSSMEPPACPQNSLLAPGSRACRQVAANAMCRGEPSRPGTCSEREMQMPRKGETKGDFAWENQMKTNLELREENKQKPQLFVESTHSGKSQSCFWSAHLAWGFQQRQRPAGGLLPERPALTPGACCRHIKAMAQRLLSTL